MRRIFVDTEFKNLPWTDHSELLWIGLADEAGNSWSAINTDVVLDEHASEFTRTVVADRMPSDEQRLTAAGLAAAVREFCGEIVDEFWAYGPTVEVPADLFGLDDDASEAHARYWDWDLELMRRLVDPWPAGWTTTMSDLNSAARWAQVDLPPNELAHHPRHDALWDLEVWRMIDAAEAARQPRTARRASA